MAGARRGRKPSKFTDKKDPAFSKSTMDMEKPKVEPKQPVKRVGASVLKIQLVDSAKVYFDIYTQEYYRGSGTLPVKKMSNFIIVNTAETLEEAKKLGKPFYKVK